MKTLSTLGLAVALATTSMLTGCELYFGSHGGEDTWNYCGSDGYYQCTGDNCDWVSATCPSGTGSNGSGYQCESSTDCAAGCYCANGVCEEAGFCSTDADCGKGYHCNTDRASCEANPPAPTCLSDGNCDPGSTCDVPAGNCVVTCACTTDAGAVQGGYGWCDETRGTCMPGTDPAGNCDGTVTCNMIAPTCADNETALIKDGCWTGACRAIATCSAAPSCSNLTHEDDCLNRTSDCAAVYTGLNCHTPTGGACVAGDTNCTCSTFVFNSCMSRMTQAPQVFQSSAGDFVDATAVLH